jgi:hypothetical protein
LSRPRSIRRYACAAAVAGLLALQPGAAGADPVIATHPRLLLTGAARARLLAKTTANDSSWQALKARADTLATYSIHPYKSATSYESPAGTIFYTYQGEGWYDAAVPLAFAYQLTGDTKYSDKLIQLAQEMIRAQSDPDNNPPNGLPPIRLDSYYASRNVAAVLAFIYDFCYDRLGATLKSQMVALMNDYYDDVSVNGYQAQNFSNASDGNYFGGHLYGVALMGYASFGDNPRAQEMIEWARIRFDGTAAPSLSPAKIPQSWRTQTFDGGMRPPVAFDFNAPAITGAPFKGGFDFQAWSYGSEELGRMIDYMLIVQSATGEDLVMPHRDWFSQIFRAEKHALFPNRFLIDPTGDWGGYQGAVVSRGLPARLAFLLEGTTDGPGAQHFAASEIVESTIPEVQVFPAPEWVDLFFNGSRPSTELVLPPYYTAFAPSYPQGATSPAGTNGAIPYFIMRSDWTSTATWASIVMGSQWWDDHQHYSAGHLIMARGGDYLLVSAGDWKTEVDAGGNPLHGRSGVLGSSLEALQSSVANTLYFDDFADFQRTDDRGSGGQSYAGIDHVVADELNADFSYVRSDLSTAYNRAGDPDDTPNRRLDFFYRNFLYLRASNVFVVYDQVQAKPSANPRGAYKKQIRWHLPEAPSITGRLARVDHGQSRLFIDTVLPANAALTVVDEWANPDPCDGTVPGCVPFGANAGTFRIEIKDPQNPLSVPFLTVLQPGSNTSSAPVDTPAASLDSKMTGVLVTPSVGVRELVLFNNQAGQVPAPITSTSYLFPGAGAVWQTLLGLVPGARYTVALVNGVVSVAQNTSGEKTASPSGVLHFLLSSSGEPNAPTGFSAIAVTAGQVDLSWAGVTGATSYEVERRAPGTGYVAIATTAGTSFSDSSVAAGRSYLYRVRATNSFGASANSTADMATTVTFPAGPFTAGTVVQAAHLIQLRSAINAARSLAGLPAATFTDADPAGTTIKSVHVNELRTALDAALSAVGLAAGGYTNSPLSGAAVKAVDFQELRDRVQ